MRCYFQQLHFVLQLGWKKLIVLEIGVTMLHLGCGQLMDYCGNFHSQLVATSSVVDMSTESIIKTMLPTL